MRVYPSTTQSKQHTEPFSSTKDLALAVPSYTQDENGLEMADNVESQSTCPANDQKLTQVVHGGHDAGCADTPEDIGRDGGKIGDGVEEWNKRNE